MGLQRATWAIAAAVLVSGCIPRTHPTAPARNLAVAPASGGAAVEEAAVDDAVASDDAIAAEAQRPVARPLTPAERQVQELEAQLAERDRTIAAVQTQLATARRQPGQGAAAAPTDSAGAGGADSGGRNAAPNAAAAQSATAPSAAAALAAKDAELGEARRQITTLETKLETEIERRKQVEGEMAKVLEETSSGPFERSGGNVVDHHLREQLASAQKEIGELRTTLATERRQRTDIERRFASLQQQLERSGGDEGDSEEIAALKERQRRVLASIQQDLATTQQRESELRAALAQQDDSGVSLADNVTSLRAENAALQRRLDDEHRQNRELASKLKLAGRVTDLIFKMQSSGSTTATAVQQ